VPSTFAVTNTLDDGSTGSLRWAINQANADTDPLAHVCFNIPGGGMQTISLASTLPTIVHPMCVDGYTQPGASENTNPLGGADPSDNAVLLITLDGSSTGGDGLLITGPGSTVKGLVIQNFGTGVHILGENAMDNCVQGNFLGTDGTQSAGGFGVIIQNASNNTVGGTTAGARNLICSRASEGVVIGDNAGGLPTSNADNVVQGNFIGINAAGTDVLPHLGDIGIWLTGPTYRTLIAGNVIAGWSGSNIAMDHGNDPDPAHDPTDNVIQGNLIGTNATGMAMTGNGVRIWIMESKSATIGGSAPGAGNLISGCRAFPFGGAVEVEGDATVQGNAVLGNDGAGIRVSSAGVSIGGNTVHDNTGPGIELDYQSTGNTIEGNSIYHNAGPGVQVDGAANGNPIEDNSIHHNGGPGVWVMSDPFGIADPWGDFNATGARIRRNSIFANDGLGIALGGDGAVDFDRHPTDDPNLWRYDVLLNNNVLPNDSSLGHYGANNYQNFPVLASAQAGPQTHLVGTLHSTSNTSFTLDFYASAEADPSGYGEGERYLSSTTVTTDGNGNVSFLVILPAATTAGEVISATATDPDGNTSEFSADVTAQAAGGNQPGDSIVLSGGATAGTVQVSLNGTGLATFTPLGPLAVLGSTGSPDTYTVNFGSTLTTPIYLFGGGAASGDTLIVNGDNSPTNVITKTPGQITWGNPVTEAVYRSGIPNTVINANGTSQNYVNDPGGNTVINGGPGVNTIVITASTGNGVAINGGPNTNSYIINLGSLAGPVSIANSSTSATNSLTVNGAPGDNTISVSGAQVTAGTQAVTLAVAAPLANLTVNGGSGNNQITVADLAVPVQSLDLNGGGGNNSFVLVNVGNQVNALSVSASSGTGTNQVQVQGTLPPTITATNVLPVVSAGTEASLNEGAVCSRAGFFADRNPAATYTATVDYGDGSGVHALALAANKTFALSHVYGTSGTFPVVVTVSDAQGGSGTCSFRLTVANVAPVAGPLSGTAQVIPGQNTVLTAAFTDAGALETHTGVFSWGDGSSSAATVTEANGAGTAAASHVYAVPGTYTVSLTVTDSGGLASNTVTFPVTVTRSILLVNLTASGALTVSGNASLNLPGTITVDSNSASALVASGNANISAGQINVAGGISRSGNATLNPAATTLAAVVADLFAPLPVPPDGSAQGAVNLSGNRSLTINPGRYTQINVSGNAHLTMNPGVYLLAGGGFAVTGNASVTGTGVLIYNASSNFPNPGGNMGGVTLSGSGTIQLSPPTTGPYTGVVLFQARDNTRALALSGNGVLGVTGSIYAVVGTVTLSGNVDLQSALVVNQMTVSGNATSTLSADGLSSVSNTADTLLAGNLVVYVDNTNGLFPDAALARVADAADGLSGMLSPYGVSVTVVDSSASADANVVIRTSSTSPSGTAADGVLGSSTEDGQITLLQGWNWYVGADPAGIAPDQYDLETIVTHELGHALGLGHSPDASSVMYATLAPGVVKRELVVADLNVPDVDSLGPHALHAGVAPLDGSTEILAGRESVREPVLNWMPPPMISIEPGSMAGKRPGSSAADPGGPAEGCADPGTRRVGEERRPAHALLRRDAVDHLLAEWGREGQDAGWQLSW
jgi:parallel beta-helix repeat protein